MPMGRHIIIMDTPAMTNTEDKIIRRQQEIDDDYELTRETYRAILQNNIASIEELKKICIQSEHPRAYEVFSTLTKSTADIADKLLEMQRKKQIVDTESAMDMIRAREESGLPVITAVVTERKFVGTAEDMQKRIAAKRQEQNETRRDNSES